MDAGHPRAALAGERSLSPLSSPLLSSAVCWLPSFSCAQSAAAARARPPDAGDERPPRASWPPTSSTSWPSALPLQTCRLTAVSEFQILARRNSADENAGSTKEERRDARAHQRRPWEIDQRIHCMMIVSNEWKLSTKAAKHPAPPALVVLLGPDALLSRLASLHLSARLARGSGSLDLARRLSLVPSSDSRTALKSTCGCHCLPAP